jgi:protein SCO1/2
MNTKNSYCGQARRAGRTFALALACCAAGFFAPVGALADTPAHEVLLNPEIAEVDVEENLGKVIEPGLTFHDHNGEAVNFGSFFDGERPVLVTLNYYRCPGLCSIQLNAVTESLRQMDWTPGDGNFRVVTVSIDPREDSKLASSKRLAHLDSLGRGDQIDWTFLTGDALNIRLLAAQLGVSYAYDKDQDQYAHPPVIMFLSPEGKVARYLYGLTYKPRDIKFALLESAEGRVGTTVDRLILSCFHYDAALGKYGPFAFGIMRLAGVFTVLIVGTALFVAWRRERRSGLGILEAQS